MNDFNTFLQEKLADPDFVREYYRNAVFFRLADQLLLLRKERGLTQHDLAEKAGTTQAVVSRLENVSANPSVESIVKLAEALDSVVEIRLIPIEEKLPDQVHSSIDANDLVNPTDEFGLIKYIVFSEVEPTARTEKQVIWKQSCSWGLADKPTFQPTQSKKKTLIPA